MFIPKNRDDLERIAPKNRDDLQRIVDQRLQESHQLEFKSQLPESGKNDDLAKDLAAMANTEGGVIIYGIEADNDRRAAKLHPFKVAGAAERIERVARSTVDEPLELGGVTTILDDGETDLGYVVVQVPGSDRAPHFFRGAAFGRISSGNTSLTRWQIGQLFARSPGFAQEFGLVLTRPGRVVVRNVPEMHQEGVAARTYAKTEHFLVFENDGDADVMEVNWSFAGSASDSSVPSVLEDIFPLDVLPPSSPVRVRLDYPSRATPVGLKVSVTWKDQQGDEHQRCYPVSR